MSKDDDLLDMLKKNSSAFRGKGGMDMDLQTLSYLLTPATPKAVRLTRQEWSKMTRGRKKAMETLYKKPWLPEGQKAKQYKIMVEKLLSGKDAWEDWQANNSHIVKYDFAYLNFLHEINLGGAIFSREAVFLGTRFTERSNFYNATFAEEAVFLESQFIEWAIFKRAKFKKEIGFQQAIFKKEANFQEATFATNINFWRATFADNVNFWKATFTEGANFWETTFSKEIDFSKARFQGSGYFRDTIFEGDKIDFNEIVLSPDSNLLFEDIEFEYAVPDFRYPNRILDMRFNKFSVPAPKKLIKKWDKQNEDRYCKLKELAISNDNHEYELLFYGHEMNSKLINFYRAKEKSFFSKEWIFDIMPTHFYKWVSNYGQSVGRPILWVAGLWLLPFICNYIADDDLLWFDLILLWHDFSLLWFVLTSLSADCLFETIKPIMPVPFFIDDFKSLWHFGTKIIASVFWFLFFLGMRNKFKI